jgi:4-amino-4-deoxy-L-arabinose transferase-like glycosyltransferase
MIDSVPDTHPLSGESQGLAIRPRRWAYAVWLIVIGGFAVLHALHLRADFPNNTPWISDWAKYTDEGWYGNAAVRAHLFGNWYLRGDFNPAPAVPVWPLLEWMLFGLSGVSIEAARGLAVAFYFVNLILSYWLLRARGPRWMALLAITFLVTNPFLYCFSRLAILEPMLTAFTLAALNLAVRLDRFQRPVLVSAGIGVLFTLMMLTKTTAVFLLPSIGWALLASLWPRWRLAVCSAAAAGAAFVATFGLWMALVIRAGLLRDYEYLFVVNKYPKPAEFYWPLLSLWWSFHGGLWVDRILIPLAGVVPVCAALAWRSRWSRRLGRNPAFGASLLAVAGYIGFMTYQNHPQPRYYAVVAFFTFLVLAMGIEAMLSAVGGNELGVRWRQKDAVGNGGPKPWPAWTRKGAAVLAFALLGGAVVAVCLNGEWTAGLAMRPEYTLVPAAQKLTSYIDQHPNGKRLLLSISGDEISMITHLPAICDDFGTQDLVSKLRDYDPGWFATWNDLDPGTLEDIHSRYSLEQVATFHALDHPDRNMLVLFKLHPLPDGQVRDPEVQNLQVALPGDKIEIPIE